jgi:hypothetical protein
MTTWTGIVGLIANLVVSTVLTLVFTRLPRGRDETVPEDYEALEAQPVTAGPDERPGTA